MLQPLKDNNKSNLDRKWMPRKRNVLKDSFFSAKGKVFNNEALVRLNSFIITALFRKSLSSNVNNNENDVIHRDWMTNFN